MAKRENSDTRHIDGDKVIWHQTRINGHVVWLLEDTKTGTSAQGFTKKETLRNLRHATALIMQARRGLQKI